MRLPARAVCAMVLAIGMACARPSYAAKRALLVGIDDYSASHFRAAEPPPADRDWHDLEGARRDVELLRGLLVGRFGFAQADIVTLLDQQATRGAILAALERDLIHRTAPGDVVVFYFAGHGSQVRNSRSRELDKMDESLVPADSRAGADDIRDKELRRIFNRALDCGARLTVILDSCHSASGGRGTGLTRGVKPDLRDVADGGDAGPRPESRGALVLAAAQDDNFAYEAHEDDGTPHGAFSWALERALREADPEEPAIDTFLRAEARLRVEQPLQEPVIAGGTEARLSAMFAAPGERRAATTRIAVETMSSDGTVVLRGGWVNGINAGSQLRAGDVRLEVTALRGVARSVARVVPDRGSPTPPVLEPGTLLDVSGWAPPPGRPLRVAVPVAPFDLCAVATAFAREAERRGIRWVADTSASHIVRWRDGAWELLARGGAVLSESIDPAEIVRRVPAGASLFVQFPVDAALRHAVVTSFPHHGIELTADVASADYVLAGRLAGDRVELAWVCGAIPGRGLPLRSAWSAADAPGTPLALTDALARLRRVFGWQHLESPSGDALPYHLAVRRTADGSFVEGDRIDGGAQYQLVLRGRPVRMPAEVDPHYVYVFVVDSDGRSVLLFPASGSVENRLPLDGRHPPAEIALGDGASFRSVPPWGVDTYFFLITDEALPNPWALEWDGVHEAPVRGPSSPLQELLASGGLTRSAPTTPNWSLQRVVFESVPPEGAHDGRVSP